MFSVRRISLPSGDQLNSASERSPSVIWRGSLLNPKGRLVISMIQSPAFVEPSVVSSTPFSVTGGMMKAIFEKSADTFGFMLPEKVRAVSDGAECIRKACVGVTTSFSMTSLFFHSRKPSFLMLTSYSPGGREMVLSVAVFSLPLIYTSAPLGSDVIERRPWGLIVTPFSFIPKR